MAAKAFSLFRDTGIEPILIKGPAAGLHYPAHDPRNSIDLDLAVSEYDFDKAILLSKSPAAAGLAIDIHRELRHLDTRAWAELFADSQIVEMAGTGVRVLRPEDHLRVLSVHWLNDGGSDKDRLWDICYVVDGRGPDFDWHAVFDPVSPTRQRWISSVIGLTHHFLDLDISEIPSEYRVSEVPDWLTKFVQREWDHRVITRPLHTCLREPRELIRQLGSRLKMNPVWATIHMEGSLDAPTRLHYRLGSAILRMFPSIKRIGGSLFKR
jgi:hypothetical protein